MVNYMKIVISRRRKKNIPGARDATASQAPVVADIIHNQSVKKAVSRIYKKVEKKTYHRCPHTRPSRRAHHHRRRCACRGGSHDSRW